MSTPSAPIASSSSSPSYRRPHFPTLSPYMVVKDAAAAIDYYKKVFNATLRHQLTMSGHHGDAVIHAELLIGDSILLISDEKWGHKGPLSIGGTPITLTLYVDSCDAVAQHAVDAGGKLISAPKNQLYGDRTALITDPFGHRWNLCTFIEEVPPEESQKKIDALFSECNKCCHPKTESGSGAAAAGSSSSATECMK